MKNIANAGIGLLLALALAVTGCEGEAGPRGDPGPEGRQGPPGPALDSSLTGQEKAFIGAGTKALLDSVTHFKYTSAGSSLVSGEGFDSRDSSLEASTFTLAVTNDVANNNLLLDWNRKILFVGPVDLTYQEIIKDKQGAIAGDDDIFPGDPSPDNRGMTGLRSGVLRKQQRLLNPHLILKEISADSSIASEVGIGVQNGILHDLVEVEDAVFPITLWVNQVNGQISKISTAETDHLHRDAEVEILFGSYQDHAGLMVPHDVILVRDGQVLWVEQRTEFEVNPTLDATAFDLPTDFPTGAPTPADFVAADIARGETSHLFHTGFLGLGIPQDFFQEAVTVTELGASTGVYHITGGSHHSLLVTQANGKNVLVEAPLYPERSEAIIAELTGTGGVIEGETITHVVATHHHEDHSGGLRAFVAHGSQIIVHKNSEFFFREIFRAASNITPDELSKKDPPPAIDIRTVGDGETISIPDGTAADRVEIVHFDNFHSNDMVMVHVPSIDAVFESDLWNPGGTDAGAGLFPQGIVQLRDAILAAFPDGSGGTTVTTMVGGHGVAGHLGTPPSPGTGTFANLNAAADAVGSASFE